MCVCVCVPEREMRGGCDSLEMPRLTCRVAQSDLQRRERDQPAELEGVRVAVRVRRPVVGLDVAGKGHRDAFRHFHSRPDLAGMKEKK